MAVRNGVIGVGAALALAASAGAAQAQDRCENPGERCGALVDPSCVEQRLGAGSEAIASASAPEECRRQIEAYRACLTDVAQNCGPATAAGGGGGGGCTQDLEQRLWDTVRESNDPDELQIFLNSCPTGPFAEIAKKRIADAQRGAAQPVATAPAAAAPAAPSAPAAIAPAGAPTGALGAGAPPDYVGAQTELRRLGLYRGGIDGDWGPGSQRAMRAFQAQAGLPQDGQVTEQALAALRAAPTPPQPAQQQGYGVHYSGTWRSGFFGTSGRSEFEMLSFDVNTGAIRGRMGIEYDGVMYRGVVSGTLTPQAGGQASGAIRSPSGSGWTTTLTYEPAGDYSVIRGRFRSVPLGGTFGLPVSGTFETRLIR